MDKKRNLNINPSMAPKIPSYGEKHWGKADVNEAKSLRDRAKKDFNAWESFRQKQKNQTS